MCFGWIDSIIRRLDEDRYARKFTPRKPDSNWSESNKKRVEKLIRLQMMAPAGLTLVQHAKKSGVWDLPPRPEIPVEPPHEFLDALDEHPQAKLYFQSLAPSYQRQYMGWIFTAKRPETRLRRISKAIALLEKGDKLGIK
ncbi:MAG: YdeI family protein [Fidelibacterota bacterium]